MKNLLDQGIEQKLIRLEDDEKYIVYVHQNKRRNYENPEEKIQAEAFLSLVLDYKYPPERVRQFVSVQMGADTREADIIVYDDALCLRPLIVVECKRSDVSELEFQRDCDQCFSYAVAEGAKYVWTTSGLKDAYYEVPTEKPKARITVPDVPQFGVKKLAIYKYAYGGGTTAEGQKLKPIEVVTQDELTARFKQAHQALWGGGELNPSEAFDELDKLIFCKVWDERKPRKKGEPYAFQVFAHDTDEKTNTDLLERVRALYEEGRKKDPEVFKDDIRLRASKVRAVVGYLQDINLSDTDLDSKGRAFETFMGSFFRGDFGQYFTPRPIVKFIVDVLPITHESKVLDTSCGSGGFLLHALDKVRCEADSFYPDEIAVPAEGRKEGARHHRHWHDFAEKNLFGIEINEQIARTAKMNMIIHDDGHTNVVAADGLLPPDDLAKKTGNKEFKANSFDFIITNPPFGSSVRQTEQAYFHQYRLANKSADWLNPKSKAAKRPAQDTEILFLEQCHVYLREGGYLAIVIPDGILTNSSLQYVRDQIESLYRIVAVVSMPQTAFAATGAGVKSSVLFLQKYEQKQTKRIEDLRQRLQDSARKKHNFTEKLANIESRKKDALKKQTGFAQTELSRRAAMQLVALREENPEEKFEIEDTPAYAAWKKSLSEQFTEELDDLRFEAIETYQAALRESQDDYQIFMAIAEEIGYDATGKATKKNDLNEIAQRLTAFLSEEKSGRQADDERVFLANLKEISGSLFDPKTYRPSSRALLARIAKSEYPVTTLRSLIVHRCAGDWGEDEDFIDEDDLYEKCLVIRGTEFDNELNLRISNGREKYRKIKKIKLERMRIEANDILIEKSGGSPDQPVGRVALLESELLTSHSICYSNFVEKIKPDSSKIFPAYLFHYLKLIHSIGVTDLLQSQTNGIRNLMIHRYLDITISVPPLSVQRELAESISKLQNEAVNLRIQANKKLEEARSHIANEVLKA